MLPDTTFVAASPDHKPDHSPIDVSSKSFWSLTSEQRDAAFALLRRDDPVSWQRPVQDAVAPDPHDPGYWAVVSHADIVTVSRDHQTYISGQGVQFDLLPPAALEMSQSFLAMDPPRHQRLRKLVSSAFTPRQVRSLDARITTAARQIVDGFAHQGGEIDFVDQCAALLPISLFADMFGIPAPLREQVRKAAADLLAWADPETLAGRSPSQLLLESTAALHEIATELINDRRARPTDDLLTNLVHGQVDGRRLDDAEIRSFFVLMSVAGTDTTQHTLSFAAHALSEFPDQCSWLRGDFDGRIDTAVEEIIRYASPVMTFRRTATRPTELGGKKIIPGDKVVMFYPSGNRDAAVFHRPERLDLSRDPNPHVGFGGGGVHFCLGHQLARTTIRELLRALLDRIPSFETGEPELLGTNFMRGIKRLPFRFEARASSGTPM